MARPSGTVATEVQTLQTLLAAHGIRSGHLLELACGTCAHGIPLAQHGFQVTGLDRAQAMLAAATARAAAAGVSLAVVQGDAVDFDLPMRQFDAAILLFETFPLISDETAIRSHFAAVHRSLRPGGIYIFDVDRCDGIRTATGEWGRHTLALPNGSVEVWHEDRPSDWVNGVNYLTLYCRIEQNGVVTLTRDDWAIHCYRPWDLALLIRTLGGWELDGFYS